MAVISSAPSENRLSCKRSVQSTANSKLEQQLATQPKRSRFLALYKTCFPGAGRIGYCAALDGGDLSIRHHQNE